MSYCTKFSPKIRFNNKQCSIFLITSAFKTEMENDQVNNIWAATRENLSLGPYKKQPAQLHRLARIVKFCLWQVLIGYIPISEEQRRRSDCANV